jgi:hypothetical protein
VQLRAWLHSLFLNIAEVSAVTNRIQGCAPIAGQQGVLVRCIVACDKAQIWRRPLYNGDVAVAFINLREEDANVRCCVSLSSLNLGIVKDPQVHKVHVSHFSCSDLM